MTIILTAHSGSDHTPENSLSFVQTMLNGEIEAVEVDVRLHPETNQLYLAHDVPNDFLDVVLLEEVFDLLHSHPTARINCDLKEKQLETRVIELSKKYLEKQQVLFSGAVDVQHMPPTWLDQLFFNIEQIVPDIYEASQHSKEQQLKRILAYAHTHSINVLNMNFHFATDEVIDFFHQEGLRLSLWTVNDFKQIDHFKKKGIYNVTTRQALSYQAYHKERGGDAPWRNQRNSLIGKTSK